MLTFLHGFLGSPNDWQPLNLPGKFLTLPGHQGNPFDLSILEREIPEKTTLIGYSLGGRLAMHFAYQFPERIERLIILSANPGLDEEKKKRIAWDEKWASMLETEGMQPFLEKWYAQPLFSSLNRVLLKERESHDPKMLAKVLRDLSPAKLPSMWEKLHEFSFPMLFLFGENDIKYHPIAKRLGKHFPVDFIPGCGHAIHIENPELCAKKIRTHVGELYVHHD